jgi:peptidoglycan/xylan/chitin deacetylase (PgdA/CDA1 family)
MPLPEDYLSYPHRSYGMDQDRYDWRPQADRQPLALPGGASVAAMIVVPIEHHPLNPTGKPFKHPGAMVTPYPDLRHYTSRDYGNRVGVFRLLAALKAEGLKASFPVNAQSLDRFRPLIQAIMADGHEIAAYGLSTDHIHYGGLDPEIEAGWIGQVRDCFSAHGLAPTTWMSPARQQSFATLDLIAEAGFTTCLDWEQDDVPVAMATRAGPVMAVPLANELDDRLVLIDRRQGEDEWADQIIEASTYLVSEGARFGGRVLGFCLTPYVSGQPFRQYALRRILKHLADQPEIWTATSSEIARL